jgi:plastocyanin
VKTILIKYAVLFSVPVLMVSGGLFFMKKEKVSLERIVTLTPLGFVPEKLVIRAGDTVTFASKVGKPFWPASDSHPTHDIYAEFDPERPIQATSTWNFTFKRPGTWNYHDHFASRFVGKIVVLTSEGEKVEEKCFKHDRSLKCMEEDIKSVLKKKGLEEGLERLAELYEENPYFRESCHSAAHTIGAEAYALFEQGKFNVLSSKSSYCGYGFYHGFMEKMLQTTGNIEEAKAFCKKAGELLAYYTSDAEGACYHGIGHGAVDGSDPTAWGDPQKMVEPGLQLCEKVAPVEDYQGKRFRCVTGAYNSLEILAQNSEYKLDAIAKDPFSFCATQKESYKQGCYTNMLPALMRIVKGSYSEAINKIRVVPEGTKQEPIRSVVMEALMDDYVRERINALDFPESGVKICRSLEKLNAPCIEGIASGLMKHGEPEREYIRAFAFCESLSSEERKTCYAYILPRLSIWYSSEKRASICDQASEAYRPLCYGKI